MSLAEKIVPEEAWSEGQPWQPVPTPSRFRTPLSKYRVWRNESACIKCGKCVEVCPYGVHTKSGSYLGGRTEGGNERGGGGGREGWGGGGEGGARGGELTHARAGSGDGGWSGRGGGGGGLRERGTRGRGHRGVGRGAGGGRRGEKAAGGIPKVHQFLKAEGIRDQVTLVAPADSQALTGQAIVGARGDGTARGPGSLRCKGAGRAGPGGHRRNLGGERGRQGAVGPGDGGRRGGAFGYFDGRGG